MNTINPQLGYSETSFFNTLIYDIFKYYKNKGVGKTDTLFILATFYQDPYNLHL